MAVPPSPQAKFESERRELEAVLSSQVFSRAPNLSRILSYVCEKYFLGDVDSIREYNIAVEALGRKPDFDPSGDSIVRVEVSRLRRRLREYYAGEGASHAVRIQLPETGYVPQFVRAGADSQPLASAGVPSETGVHERPATTPAQSQLLIRVLVGLLVLFATVCCWLAWQNLRLRAQVGATAPDTPLLDSFWTQFLGEGRRSLVVTSDANVMILGNILNRPVTLHEYRISSYPQLLLEPAIPQAEFRNFMARFMSTYLTNTQDAIVAAELRRITSRYGADVSVVYARDYRPIPNSSDNVILLGHRKANPCVELFEDRVNFAYAWDPATSKGTLINRNPQKGEKDRYPVEVDRSYATIYYRPGSKSSGSLLLLGGNDMAGVDLGGRFLCSEASLKKLRAALDLNSGKLFPSFEVLLAARRVLNVPFEPEIVAVRVPSP